MLQLYTKFYLISMNNLPEDLKKIIDNRKDLIDLGFLEKNNERDLVKWVILYGFNEYPEFKKGDFSSNSILMWLQKGSSTKRYQNLPKIFLAIWDIHKSHQRRWPFPELNNFYMIWIEKNWKNLKIDLPEFKNIFKINLNFVNNLGLFIFDFFWIMRKPLSIKTEQNLGVSVDKYFAKKLRGFEIQFNVISALIYRELKTRVSQVRFGVMGVFIEPLGVMSVFLVLFSILRANRGPLDVLLFLGTGIVLYTLFSDIAIRSANGMSANEALFFYKPVKPIDTVIARTIVESGLYAIVFIVIIFGTYLIRQRIVLADVSLLIMTYFALVIFSLGLGLFLLVATFIYPSINQFIPLALRPLWFISGVFVSLSALPQWLRPFVSWNPVLQAIEITRYSFTIEYNIDKNLISLNYLWSCALLSLCFGLCVYSFNEKKLLTK